MVTLTSFALSAVLLAATPDSFEAGGQANLTQAQAFTIVANVLGAATACDRIAHDHVSAVARQVGAIATSRVESANDVVAIERVLITSAMAGRRAVEEGMMDCKTVEAAFGNIEEMVLQTPI